MYMSPGSVWMTLPNTTWSTCSGSTPARSSAAVAAVAPRSDGGMSLRLFPYDPTAVRAAEEITTLVTVVPVPLLEFGQFCTTGRLSTVQERNFRPCHQL